MGCHLNSYASQGRWANTFGNIVYVGAALQIATAGLTYNDSWSDAAAAMLSKSDENKNGTMQMSVYVNANGFSCKSTYR